MQSLASGFDMSGPNSEQPVEANTKEIESRGIAAEPESQRERALYMALDHRNGQQKSAEEVVADAKVFEAYLTGKAAN